MLKKMMVLRIKSSFDFLKILGENKIFFNLWSAHLRNRDFLFGNHFEKVPFLEISVLILGVNSLILKNFSGKLTFDLKVQSLILENYVNLVILEVKSLSLKIASSCKVS